jgi:hypothetical protein
MTKLSTLLRSRRETPIDQKSRQSKSAVACKIELREKYEASELFGSKKYVRSSN